MQDSLKGVLLRVRVFSMFYKGLGRYDLGLSFFSFGVCGGFVGGQCHTVWLGWLQQVGAYGASTALFISMEQ